MDGVKIRPLGGWKVKGGNLTMREGRVKIRPLGGWKGVCACVGGGRLKSVLLEDGKLFR